MYFYGIIFICLKPYYHHLSFYCHKNTICTYFYFAKYHFYKNYFYINIESHEKWSSKRCIQMQISACQNLTKFKTIILIIIYNL